VEDFVISDTHAFHGRMLEPRGFATVEDMNRLMAERINAAVSRRDRLIHLGDFSFGNIANALLFREMINCVNVVLVPGNHDERFRDNPKFSGLFANGRKFRDILMHKIKGIRPVVFAHSPIEEWYSKHYGSVHLHGHCHRGCRELPNRYNCVAEKNDYTPLHLVTLVQKIGVDVPKLED